MKNLSVRILMGLLFGLLAGILASKPSFSFLSSLSVYIEPIGKLWVNAIRMTVVPLLVALLITSIAGQSSTENAAKLSGKTIVLFVVMIVICCLYAFLLAPQLIGWIQIDPLASERLLASTGLAGNTLAELPPFRTWFVGLIPANPIRAAADANMLPLLIFTGLMAMSLLKIDPKHRLVFVGFFTALKEAMFVLIGWIMAVAPIGVFALVFPLTATLGFSAIKLLSSFIAVACGLIFVITLLLYPVAIVVGKIKPSDLIRVLLPVQIIGFTTRSSLASLPATIAATEQLGIHTKISGVVLPFAVTLFKFASPVARISGTYFIANLYGIDLSINQLVVVALTIGLFSFYSPGIPSGGLLIMTPVYVSLGLPVEGIGLLIAVDLIVDMFITASNVTANVVSAVVMAKLQPL